MLWALLAAVLALRSVLIVSELLVWATWSSVALFARSTWSAISILILVSTNFEHFATSVLLIALLIVLLVLLRD